MRPFWSGTITFGLVSVPVDLYPANRSSRVSLRMLGPGGRPLNRRYYSEKTGRELESDSLVRGYEYAKGKYVLVSDEDLERLAPEKTRDIDLKQFVPVDQIPPLYFERAYFLAPSKGSAKAYRLLADSMARSGRAGIATFVMRGKEYLVAILSENGILRAETMRFDDEIRKPAEIGLPEKPKVPSSKVRSFEGILRKHSKRTLSRAALKDEYAEKVLKLVQKKKSKGKDLVEAEAVEGPKEEPVDIMAVLKASLKAA
jgi:DNA end-binding protein Ku